MAPSLIHLTSQLRQLIFYQLDNNLLKNALFLAGRLYACEQKNPDSIHLLALCHQRLGQHQTAYDFTKGYAIKGTHLGCSYIFAQSSLAVGKFADGIHALEKARPLWEGRNVSNKRQDTTKRFIPDASAVYTVMGDLLAARDDTQRAVECYTAALKLNPFMWDSFERIYNLGRKVKVQSIFKDTPEAFAYLLPLLVPADGEVRPASTGTQAQIQKDSRPTSIAPPQTSNYEPTASRSRQGAPSSSSFPEIAIDSSYSGTNGSFGMETPPAQPMQIQPVNGAARPNHSHNTDAPNAPRRRIGVGAALTQEVAQDPSRMRSLSRRRLNQSSTEEDLQDQAQQSHAAIPLKRNMSGSVASSSSSTIIDPSQAPPRRSRRLFTQLRPNSSKAAAPPPPSIGLLNPTDALEPKKIKATGTRGRSATQSTVGRVVSGNRKPAEGSQNVLKDSRVQAAVREETAPQQVHREDNEDRRRHFGAFGWLMDLFGRLGTAYAAQSCFDNEEAIKRYNLLPAGQRDTPWVLAQLGKAYLEQSKYIESEKQFVRLRKLVPSRLEDMEIYSTVLWHLRQDNELTYLAHELMDADRLSPEAWCALGNSFSLHRDHDQALKCFRRATQLNPKMSYAFTLQGHEHIANEDYEKAQQAFRRALSSDGRHYNAWYGLGKVYQQLGQQDAALRHYRAAASINPTSSVLIYCMGRIFEQMKRYGDALREYSRALKINNMQIGARFRTIKVLMTQNRFAAALEELKVLKDQAPDESNVHFLLGNVYKQLDQNGDALRHYTVAMNLDPKAAPMIKEAMQAMNDDYDMEGMDSSDVESD